MSIKIEKIKGEIIENTFKKYMDNITFLDYDIYQDKIYNDLSEKKIAVKICRDAIDEEYIYEQLNELKIKGKIAMINGEYVGFILYEKKEDYLYLTLIGTIKNSLTKGIPLGKILIKLMENYANEQNIDRIEANAIVEAIEFYKGNDWEVISEDKKEQTFLIQKKMNKIVMRIKPGYLTRFINYIYSFVY